MTTDSSQAAAICLVTPVYNDWTALKRLCAELELALAETGVSLDIVVVNDGSARSEVLGQVIGPKIIKRITVLDLRSNVGHQLAIAVGLHFAQHNRTFDAVLVMDADGEDSPTDAARLIAAWRANPARLFVAGRAKRSEHFLFKTLYQVYRVTFRLLTGRAITFGNFSLIPTALLPAVLNRPELIHHLAATLLRTGLPIEYVPSFRGRRYGGESQMNIPALVLHAVRALAVFSDVLFSRILIGSAIVGVLCAVGSLAVASLRLLTDLAFPNWATSVITFLTLLTAQVVIFVLCTGFLLLAGRAAMLMESLETSKLIGRISDNEVQ